METKFYGLLVKYINNIDHRTGDLFVNTVNLQSVICCTDVLMKLSQGELLPLPLSVEKRQTVSRKRVLGGPFAPCITYSKRRN